MNEQNKKQIIAAAVLGVILVGVLIRQFVFAPGPGAAAGDAAAGKAAKTPGKTAAKAGGIGVLDKVDVDIEALIKSVEVEPIDYKTVRIARNPMNPLVGNTLPQVNPNDPNQNNVTFPNQDPTQPPTEPSTTPESSATDAYAKRVTGIVWDVSNPVAVVDDEVVTVGHVFPNGTQVYSIEPSRVILKVGDKTIPIEMKDM